MASKYALVEDADQKVWLWIAGLFGVFYLGEAILFWGQEPIVRMATMRFVHWGAFAAALVWVLRRGARRHPLEKSAQPGVPRGLQSWVLSLGITAAAIGLTYIVIRYTGNITLGHVVLAGTLFEAAIVIAGMSGSLGWFACSLTWAATAIIILVWPAWQDITLGAGVTVGMALVGAVRQCVAAAPASTTREETLEP